MCRRHTRVVCRAFLVTLRTLHSRTHAHTPTCTHARTLTHVHSRTHARTHPHALTRCTHAHTCAHAHTCTRARTSAHVDVQCERACLCRCAHRAVKAHVSTGALSAGLGYRRRGGLVRRCVCPRGTAGRCAKGHSRPCRTWGGELGRPPPAAGLNPLQGCRASPSPPSLPWGTDVASGSRGEPAAPGPRRWALAVRARPRFRRVSSAYARLRAGHGAGRGRLSRGGAGHCDSPPHAGVVTAAVTSGAHGAGQTARRPGHLSSAARLARGRLPGARRGGGRA